MKNSPADIVVEATFTSPVDGEPAVSHVRWAIESGKHVVTTNKGPVALQGTSLSELAANNGVRFEYEGAVMSGTPVIRLAHKMLGGLELNAVQGILNGTSNYVLGRMEAGLRLDESIAEAQNLGYAEADPTADIGGSDVRLKVAILANELLGANIHPHDVHSTGIQDITSADVTQALANGLRWKLIGEARRESDGSITASVQPVALPADHPLAGISGATNAVSFTTDLLGAVTVSGPGAGRVETAYALISDIIAVDEFAKGAVRA
ncbi:homoserine dehydrogenase [Arthrobacter sp. YN]|uniref:homoserine dehydrogenase n=1 Tax=Arthrobacter sp. YN TaxID=2020486 RepID=UPI001E4EB6AE|nr:homoserine dehydrogenase [Arthrobacter sp. YN]